VWCVCVRKRRNPAGLLFALKLICQSTNISHFYLLLEKLIHIPAAAPHEEAQNKTTIMRIQRSVCVRVSVCVCVDARARACVCVCGGLVCVCGRACVGARVCVLLFIYSFIYNYFFSPF